MLTQELTRAHSSCTLTHTCTHADMLTRALACTSRCSCTHTCTHADTCSHACTLMHAQTQVLVHAHIHMHSHMHTGTHAHTHRLVPFGDLSLCLASSYWIYKSCKNSHPASTSCSLFCTSDATHPLCHLDPRNRQICRVVSHLELNQSEMRAQPLLSASDVAVCVKLNRVFEHRTPRFPWSAKWG